MGWFLKELNRQASPQSFLAEILRQFNIFKGLYQTLRGFTKRQIYILTERAKMSSALWFKVMNHYQWRCGCCGVFNWQNKNGHLPKMQADHIQALWNGGKTEWNNLQVLCSKCNKKKGVKTIDYRHR